MDDEKPIAGTPFTNAAHAPMIFFDGAPTMAAFNGIIAVTLSASFYEVGANGQVDTQRSVVAHLRTNLAGVRILRDSIDKVMLLAQQTETASKN